MVVVMAPIGSENGDYVGSFQHANDYLAVFKVVDNGRDFVLEYLSPPVEGVDQVKREGITGEKIIKFFPGSVYTEVLEVLKDVHGVGLPKRFKVPYYENNELKAWWEGVIYKISTDKIIATFNVFEVKKLEEELKEKEEYKTIFENTGSATAIIGEEDIILLCNREFEKLTGYSKEEIEGKKSFLEFVAKEDLEKVKRHHESRRKNPRLAPRRYTFKLRDKQGKTKHVNLTVDMIPGTEKTIISLTDITKIKEYEKFLKKALMEKEALLREIHHRVKNNLQIIISLLNLQTTRIKDEKTRKLIQESQRRIKTMALIHEHLYQTETLARINIKDYIKKLIEDLTIFYNTKIKKELEIENIQLDIDTAVPLGLIINELATNSIKYAFPNGKGTITIKLTTKNNKIELTVADNGIGLPESIDLKKTKTLGLKLVNILTKQLNGKINLKTKPGTKFKITIPKKITPLSRSRPHNLQKRESTRIGTI